VSPGIIDGSSLSNSAAIRATAARTAAVAYVLGAALLVASCLAGTAIAATPSLSLGGSHTCAVQDDGVVKCFGSNYYGQLGNSSFTGLSGHKNPSPITVNLGGRAIQVEAGYQHTCALLLEGIVKCFGRNATGQLGTPVVNETHPIPTSVYLGMPAVQLAAGYAHTCALLIDGTVKCFGYNNRGQLGRAATGEAANPTPTLVANLSGVVQIDAGGYHTCALLAGGTVKCFGSNLYGQLGGKQELGTNNPNPAPTTIEMAPAKAIRTGTSHTCAEFADGQVRCFGQNFYGQLGHQAGIGTVDPNNVPGPALLGASAIQVSTGDDHTCAITTDAAVKCYGWNRDGQLGRSTNFGTDNANLPDLAAIDVPAVQISAGGRHTCVLLSDGYVRCAGSNSFGQLGAMMPAANGYTPMTVEGLRLFVPSTGAEPSPASAPGSPSASRITLAARIAKPKLRKKRVRSRIYLSGRVRLNALGLTQAACSGRLAVTAKVRRKAIAAKQFALRFSSGACSAKVKIPFSHRHAGKKVRLNFRVAGSSTLDARPLTIRIQL
jgi:alpha-tubulin suppressor-like RCC1 family protein